MIIAFILKEGEYQRYTYLWIISFIILTVNILLIPYIGVSWRELFFLIQIIFTILIFEKYELEVVKYLHFVNFTYIIFLILSYLVYGGYLTPGLRSSMTEGLNQFDYLNIGVFTFDLPIKTLIGFDGSTSSIDAYSIFVGILNIVYRNKSKYSKYIALLCFINVIWTARLTPIVMIIVPLMLFVVPKIFRRLSLKILLITIFTSMFIPYYLDESYRFILDMASHGRASLWDAYIHLLYDSDLLYKLFGFRSHKLPEIILSSSSIYHYNPHSSYLRILLSFGSIFYILLFIYLYKKIITNMKNDHLFIVIIILVAGIVNVNIINNHNPIWIISLVYFINVTKDLSSQKQLVSKNK